MDEQTTTPAWKQINNLFAKHGLPAPPTRLRDVLVEHLVTHRESKARGGA